MYRARTALRRVSRWRQQLLRLVSLIVDLMTSLGMIPPVQVSISDLVRQTAESNEEKKKVS
jgi:hypothetical protein